MKTLRFLEDYKIPGGQDIRKGQFVEIGDEQLVALYVENGIAKEQTQAEYDQELRQAEHEKELRALEKRKLDRAANIRVVGEREDPAGGFKGIAHLVHDVYKAGPDGRNRSEALKSWDAHCKTAGHMNEGDDSQGGYLVPPEFRANILNAQIEASIVRQRATVVPMATNRISFPAVNDASHATTTHGGITIYRPGEAGEKSVSKPTFGQVELTLHKLVGMIYVSEEIMTDSPISIEPMLNKMFGEALAFQEDDDYINGTGINQALGFLNAPCLVTVGAEVGQAADTLVYENIVNMWSRLHPNSHQNAVWLANNDCFPQIAAMGLAVGTGGSAAYMPANGLAGSPYGTLMGRPLILTEKMDTIGDLGDIAVCDFSQYLIGQKSSGAISAASSMHFRFNYDEQTLRFVMRTDGQPWWLSALTPRYSTNTLSPFVTLEART